LIHWLIDNSFDALTNSDKCALHESAEYDNLEAMLFCMDEGIDWDSVDSGQTNALMLSAAGTGLDCLKLLLKGNGIHVNARNKMSNTALHFAARSGNTEAGSLLLENGADLSLENVSFS